MGASNVMLIYAEMACVGRDFIENSQNIPKIEEIQLFNWLAYPCWLLRTNQRVPARSLFTPRVFGSEFLKSKSET
jgi:hypothetical protein